MKTGIKLNFGIRAVSNAPKAVVVNVDPQLIVNSTSGKFVLTAPATRAIGLLVGENVMFANNIASIEEAIAQRTEDVVNYAAENGIDLNSYEGRKQFVANFAQWFIAKGVARFDAKGEPMMSSVRMSKEDKAKYLDTYKMDIVTANRELLISRVGDANASDEELAASLTIDDVVAPEYHVHSGSKTAATGNATGTGVQVNFTDTSVWNQLKSELEDKNSVNRIFDVMVDDAVAGEYNNGKENVQVMYYPIVFKEDKKPLRTGKTATSEATEETTEE